MVVDDRSAGRARSDRGMARDRHHPEQRLRQQILARLLDEVRTAEPDAEA